ncbi:MAG: zinc ribbon domain-containing protein [Chloroflexi bacterium]|nr:zinc ribbon domain-containing protein [Chloroflexota bacterium]
MEEISAVLGTLSTLVRWVIVVVGAYAVAIWWALVVWTFIDIRTRSRDFIVQGAATLLVLVFSLPGALIYLILRPKETLAEAYERDLEEEYLLRDIEDKESCPSCGSRTQGDYLYCPVCGAGLKQECGVCRKLLRLDWNLCPYCGQRVGPRVGSVAVTSEETAYQSRRATAIDSPA